MMLADWQLGLRIDEEGEPGTCLISIGSDCMLWAETKASLKALLMDPSHDSPTLQWAKQAVGARAVWRQQSAWAEGQRVRRLSVLRIRKLHYSAPTPMAFIAELPGYEGLAQAAEQAAIGAQVLMQSAADTASGDQAPSLGSFEHACWADAAVERLAVEGHTSHGGWTIIPMISAVHKVQTCAAI